LIDYERLQAFFGADSYDQLRTTHKGWVEEQLQVAGKKRQDEWTSSIAVGSKAFVEDVKARLRFRAKGRDVVEAGERYQLRENLSSYKALFGVENEDIALKNTYFWDVKSE
jgi:putative transposase